MLNKFFKLFLPRKKVGLALGGGVARGLAHIGVLKVLHKNKIPVDYIAGTSIGAMISAIYAAGISPEKMEKIAVRTGWAQLLRLSFSSVGPFSGEGIYRFMGNRIGGGRTFAELKIPLQIVATDLKSGRPFIFKEGLVARAVQASATFPGIFIPVSWQGQLLVDGGIVNNVPSSIVRQMGADFVIAVDCVPGEELVDDPKNVVQAVGRAVDLMLKKLSEPGRTGADILIEPEFDEDIWHLDLHLARSLIRDGEAAALKVIGNIKKQLGFIA